MSDSEQKAMLDTKPKPFVFVLMPFDEAFTDVYRLGIKQACDKAGAYAERLDDQIFTESMLQRIYNQIAKADIIVADMTGRNSNVFYEVGYAHALGKVVIHLTKSADDIPFDLKHYPHIVYQNVTQLLPRLELSIAWAIQQSAQRLRPTLPVTVRCNTIVLQGEPVVEVWPLENTGEGPVGICLYLTYENIDRLSSVKFKVAIWASRKFHRGLLQGREDIDPVIHTPKGQRIFNAPEAIRLLPGECVADNVLLHCSKKTLAGLSGKEVITVRLSTDAGVYDYSFRVKILEDDSKA